MSDEDVIKHFIYEYEGKKHLNIKVVMRKEPSQFEKFIDKAIEHTNANDGGTYHHSFITSFFRLIGEHLENEASEEKIMVVLKN